MKVYQFHSRDYHYSWRERLLFPYFGKAAIPMLSGKTVLITGASSGIGKALAETIAQPQLHLILIARNQVALSDLKSTLEKKSCQVTVLTGDLRAPEDRQAMLEYLKKVGSIHYFISNAGHSIYRSVLDSIDRSHDTSRLMQLHYQAPVEIILALLPQFLSSRTHIINVSALNVLLPVTSKWAAYQASKVAIDQWLQSTAIELRSQGLYFSTLYLPLVKTSMVQAPIYTSHYPMMSPQHVAHIISQMMYHPYRTFKPWWSVLVTWTRVINRNILEKIFMRFNYK